MLKQPTEIKHYIASGTNACGHLVTKKISAVSKLVVRMQVADLGWKRVTVQEERKPS